MKQEKYLLTIILIMFSLVLVDKGITGMVVSQTCCLPPNCDAENACYSGKPLSLYRLDASGIFFIVLALAIGIVAFHTLFFKK